MKVKGKYVYESLDREGLEDIAKQLVGKPLTLDFGKVIGKVLSATVVDDHIEYKARVDDKPTIKQIVETPPAMKRLYRRRKLIKVEEEG
jgi:hypothetical protein